MGIDDGSATADDTARTQSAPEWNLEGIDTERPSPARIYDYYLGGAHNFEVDRKAAAQLHAIDPHATTMARANRAFLRRVVEYLVRAGVRQFLDIGSGIPTVGHVHEVAHAMAPESRVVFVDIDPVAVAHSRDILAGNDRTAVIQADVRQPEAILAAPELRNLLDLTQPVAVLLVALLHYVPDDADPAGIIAKLVAPLAPGSCVAISHGTDDGPIDMAAMRAVGRQSGVDVTWRDRAQVAALLGDLAIVEPGVVWVSQWHPDSAFDETQPELTANYAAVARKDGPVGS